MANKKHDTPDGVVTLMDDLGNEVHFEYLDIIEYEGIEYAVLFPLDDDNNQVAILRVNFFDGETEELSGVEDQEVLEAVFKIFIENYKD
ncbi:MAG: DUF1292 domain-containing protein [Oscillospiraceae bacterium]|nr:DUF1292 domain-containing protein [Oscillospiraceae bacterium]